MTRRSLFARLLGALAAVPLVGRAASRYAVASVPKRYAMTSFVPPSFLAHRCPYCDNLPADWVCPASSGIGTGEGKSLRVTKYDW